MDYVNIDEIEYAAKLKLPESVYDFCAGGSSDEITLKRNRSVFSEVGLVPRVLTGCDTVNLAVNVLGIYLPFPILGAPIAFQCLLHVDGEIAIANALHNNGLIYTCSTMSTISLEEIAEKSPGLNFFQLYALKDHNLTLQLIRCAEMAGYRAIMLTVDVPIMGKRERDLKNKFTLPEHLYAS